MAAHLAQLGIVACVIQYTLYPDALVPQMVREVSAAFSWVLDHVHKYGGDVKRVRGKCSNLLEVSRAAVQ
jgi:acetyl esterase/lipase